MGFEFSRASRQNMEGIDDRLIDVAELALEITTVDFGIPDDGGQRSDQEQYMLFDGGFSNCDGKIKVSKHQKIPSEALDFFAYVGGSASWKMEHITIVAAAFLQAGSQLKIPLSWSGLWKYQYDFCHIELVD